MGVHFHTHPGPAGADCRAAAPGCDYALQHPGIFKMRIFYRNALYKRFPTI